MKKRLRLREVGRVCFSDISNPSLSNELLIEILSRVGSSKYAIRCKLVSKVWSSLINSSYYMRRWCQINAKDEDACLVLLTQYVQHNGIHYCYMRAGNYSTSNASLEFKFPKNSSYVNVVATHKDVVLCSSGPCSHKIYYLWNPFTMQWTTLPRPSPTTVHDGWNILAGLYVYDDTNNYTFKFKVLRIIMNCNKDWKVEMYSSENSSAGWTPIDSSGWRDSLPPNFPPYQLSFSSVAFYNGMLIWLVTLELREEERHWYVSQIIGFKINQIHDGEADFVQLPLLVGHEPHLNNQAFTIGKCQERLILSQLLDTAPLNDHLDDDYDYAPDLKLRIWQFDSQSEGWEFVHELVFNQMEDSVAYSVLKSFFEHKHWTTTVSVMAFHPYNEDIIYLLFSGPYDFYDESENLFYIISCDIRKRTFEVIRRFPESLIPLDIFPLLKPCWPTTLPLLPPP